MDDILTLPPFPPLEWEDGYAWTGTIVLDAWAGFQSRRGPYGSLSAATASDGAAALNVMTPNDEKTPPSPAQAAACQYLRDHQEEIRDAVLQAVFAKYPDLQELYGYEGDEASEYLPDIERPEQLRALIGLSNVHIFATAKDGMVYVGLEFGCTWDSEHGLGAMTHTSRVVEIGGADTAILEWIATADAERSA